LPVAAVAQTQTTQPPQTATTTDQTPLLERTTSHWLASGFVGSNFGGDADEASVDFGGTIGYLWRGVAGAEFQANFSPDFELSGTRSGLLFEGQPWINSYMANAIGAVPLGVEGQFQPYLSGGLGVLTLRSDSILSNGDRNELEPDDSRFAGNIGGGLMGYVGNFGFRGDIRYFRGFEQGSGDVDPVESRQEAIGTQILSELAFWRINGGVAVRW
jgi:hypothetical protein